MLRRIRSSRQIEYAIKHSIDFMWLVSGRTIDHTTISEFRRRNLEEIRKLHKRMLRYAMDLGLAKLSELCLDGTRIRANANRYKTWTVKRLEKLLADVQNQLDAALAEMETNDSVDDLLSNEHKADQLPPEIAELKVRLSRLQQIHQELKTVDERRKAEGIDPDENPAQLPKTDLDSRILPNKEGGYAPNYTPMCMNEMLGGFIVNASVEIGNVEHACLIATVDTVQKEYGITIDTLFGDCAYSTGENLAAMEARKINFLSPPAERVYENNPHCVMIHQSRFRRKTSAVCPSIPQPSVLTDRRLCTMRPMMCTTARTGGR